MALVSPQSALAGREQHADIGFDGYEALGFGSIDGAIRLSTRPGAGQTLAGVLSSLKTEVATILATPASARAIGEVLQQDRKQSSIVRPTLLVHIAAAEPNEENGALVPHIGSLLNPIFGKRTTILFSGSEVARGVATAEKLAKEGQDVIHVYDAINAAQEQRSGETNATPFEQRSNYHGSADATKVIIVPASLHSANATAALASTDLPTVAILTVGLWSDEVLASLPAGARELYVYTEEGARGLFDDVLGASIGSGRRVLPIQAPADGLWTVHDWAGRLSELAGKTFGVDVKPKPLLQAEAKLAVVWSSDDGPVATLARRLASRFASQSGGVNPRLLTQFDNFVGKSFGVQQSALLLEPPSATSPYAVSAIAETSPPSLLLIHDPVTLLHTHAYDPLASIGPETQVVLAGCSWAPEDVSAKLGKADRARLSSNSRSAQSTFVIDSAAVVKASGISVASATGATAVVDEIAFWLLYTGDKLPDVELVNLISTPLPGANNDDLAKLVEATRQGLQSVAVTPEEEGNGEPAAPAESDQNLTDEATLKMPRAHLAPTAFDVNAFKSFKDLTPSIVPDWIAAAKRLLFPEAYKTAPAPDYMLEDGDEDENVEYGALRPDLPEETTLLTVTETRRLTPLDYDRNVFHIEFSTAGTGFKYAVGEALGVHGWNDEGEVREFLDWFGLVSPDQLVAVPSRLSPRSQTEYRTVFQVCQQVIDLFGRPGKAFYAALAKCATNKDEANTLKFIASNEGSATFKKWAEVDTVCYADVIRAFPSAKENLGFDGLVREVAPIKPRHYSIASSQNFVGDSVHLLVVTVDWHSTKFGKRFGQCTRYLAGLKPGEQITVSLKPSVMKLPPKDTDPLILAGLGTGAAPFRAFIQEREWQRDQGLDVGPILYYFGSRHRSKEYLYGEEIEAWVQDGIVTHTGLAFSRDQKNKIYIQNKMVNDGKLLADSLDEGSFYLCGPTWPVPDVFEAITTALQEHRGMSKDQAAEHIEDLKEKERYVLEVY